MSRAFEHHFVPAGGCIRNLVAIYPVVSEEKSFETVDGRRRAMATAYTMSCSKTFGSVELHVKYIKNNIKTNY